MEILSGKSVSPGIAYGKIMYFCDRKSDFSNEYISKDQVALEIQALEDGIYNVENSLKASIAYLKEQNRNEEITLYEARILLLSDIIETGQCRNLIEENLFSARHAVLEASTNIRLSFENLEDDFMRERVYDIKQVSEMLLVALEGERISFPHLTEPSIIVAEELVPEGTFCFERDNILGIVIKNSTYNSHISILARIWNVPALAEIAVNESWNEKYALVDAVNGKLYIEPDDSTKAQFDLS